MQRKQTMKGKLVTLLACAGLSVLGGCMSDTGFAVGVELKVGNQTAIGTPKEAVSSVATDMYRTDAEPYSTSKVTNDAWKHYQNREK